MTSKAIRVLASPLPLIHSSPAPVASLNFSKQGKHIPAPGPLHCLLPGMPFPQISAWLSLPSRLCSHVSLSVRSFLIPLPKKHPLTFPIPLCCCTVFVVFASSWHVLKVFSSEGGESYLFPQPLLYDRLALTIYLLAQQMDNCLHLGEHWKLGSGQISG